MADPLTDAHHDWVANTFGTDPRASAAPTGAPPGGPADPAGAPPGGPADPDEALKAALAKPDWKAAAKVLKGLGLYELKARVAKLKTDERAAIHTAAVQDSELGPTSDVALETAPVSKPADPDKKPDRTQAGGQPAPANANPQSSSSPSAAMQKAAEAALQEFLATKEGKELKDKAEKTIDSIPPAIKYGVGGAAVVGALAGLAVEHKASPISTTPAIPVGKIGEIGIKIALTWEGPVDKPTKIGATFTFDLPGGGTKPQPKPQHKDTAAGAAGPEAPPRPELTDGKPALIGNFDTGKMGVDKIMQELAKHTGPAGLGRIIVVGYFVPQDAPADTEAPVKDRTDDAAREQAETMKRAIGQMVDASRYKVESDIEPKVSGGRNFGLGAEASALGTHDMAVIFIPQS